MTHQAMKAGPNAKPQLRSDPSRRDRKQAILFMATMLVAAALFTVAISGRRHKLKRRQEEKMSKKQGEGSVAMDVRMCERAGRIAVCSHQLLNAPPGGMLGLSSPPDGSVVAMEALWRSGVRCFDVDVVTLRDGDQLVAHPSRFAAAIVGGGGGAVEPGRYSLREAREAGADEVGFPVLHHLLERYAALVKENGGAFESEASEGKKAPRFSRGVLFFDLKGPNVTAEHLQKIELVVKELGIEGNIAIGSTALEAKKEGPKFDIISAFDESEERNDRQSSVLIGLVLKDRVEEDRDTGRLKELVQKHPSVKLLSTSIKFEPKWFQEVAKLSLPLMSWVVDDEAGLIRAIENGVSAVISNDPVALDKALRKLRQRC